MEWAALTIAAVVVATVALLVWLSRRRAWNAGGEDDARRDGAALRARTMPAPRQASVTLESASGPASPVQPADAAAQRATASRSRGPPADAPATGAVAPKHPGSHMGPDPRGGSGRAGDIGPDAAQGATQDA